MSEEYGYTVRDDEVDLMHAVKPVALEDYIDSKMERLVEITMKNKRELRNLIDFILYPHTHREITRYANNLRHRLEEK